VKVVFSRSCNGCDQLQPAELQHVERPQCPLGGPIACVVTVSMTVCLRSPASTSLRLARLANLPITESVQLMRERATPVAEPDS